MRVVLIGIAILSAGCTPAPDECLIANEETDLLEDGDASCSDDDGCELIEGHCGCQTGGTRLAVAESRIADIDARRSPAAPCTQEVVDTPSCRAHEARCVDGTCRLVLTMDQALDGGPGQAQCIEPR